MKYLLDTCVLSELCRKTPNHGLVSWLEKISEEHLHISVVTLMEIQKGIAKLEAGERRQALQLWLDEDLTARFAGRILHVNQDIALEWGTLLGAKERSGDVLPLIDSLLATTAIQYNLVLVTRNMADFERMPARLHNPWE